MALDGNFDCKQLTPPSPSLLDSREISRVHIPLAMLGFYAPLVTVFRTTHEHFNSFNHVASPIAEASAGTQECPVLQSLDVDRVECGPAYAAITFSSTSAGLLGPTNIVVTSGLPMINRTLSSTIERPLSRCNSYSRSSHHRVSGN